LPSLSASPLFVLISDRPYFQQSKDEPAAENQVAGKTMQRDVGGEDGYLAKKGLVTLPKKELDRAIARARTPAPAAPSHRAQRFT
jgi:hypothetical protein